VGDLTEYDSEYDHTCLSFPDDPDSTLTRRDRAARSDRDLLGISRHHDRIDAAHGCPDVLGRKTHRGDPRTASRGRVLPYMESDLGIVAPRRLPISFSIRAQRD